MAEVTKDGVKIPVLEGAHDGSQRLWNLRESLVWSALPSLAAVAADCMGDDDDLGVAIAQMGLELGEVCRKLDDLMQRREMLELGRPKI